MSTESAARRHALKTGLTVLAGVVFARPALSKAAHDAGDEAKIDRALVGYGEAAGPDGHHCGDCVNFIAPSHCRLVAGEVSPGGTCLSYGPNGAR